MEQIRSPLAKPIRVGIIGLSTKPGAWATLAHFPRLHSSPNFQITAVCNSSLESTNAAIKHFNLPSTTAAHTSYESLAQDENVDLFVVSTRADAHYECALPALLNPGSHKKDIYIEWPLASSVKQAQELVSLAQKSSGSIRTIIGLQGRASPSILRIRSIIDSGRLGDIHSVNYQGWINVWQNNAASRRYQYFMDRKVGGNLLTIYGGHVLDSIFYACGELLPSTEHEPVHKILSGNLRRRMRVQEEDGSLTDETWDKNTPDQMMLIGRLDRKPIQPLFSFHLRAGARFIDGPGSQWRIYGSKGELVVDFASAGPQIGPATKMLISDFDQQKVVDVLHEVDEGGEEWTSLPSQAQNIGRLYEEYARGGDYGDWELALKRHELIEQFYDHMA